ncbi:MFS transporter [Neofusicoccum parvum]|uniref:MFS transporter n=1 Tax=Neofusicoccum parvum TaxID=310453 RepID=A0ACB5SDM9_9PEZI|nr:MFS transporter [Neofusicoccum parvum]
MAATGDHHHHRGGGGHDAANPRASVDSDNIELGSLDARDDEPFLPGDDGASDDSDGIAAGASPYPARSSSKKPRVIWLTVFFLMNSLAFGIAVVPRVNLVVSLICRQSLPPAAADAAPVVVGGFNPQCQAEAVSSTTAMVQSAGNVISGVLSMGVSAFLNALSDRVGRVRVIAYAATVLGAVECVYVVLAKTPVGTSYRWLYLAYTLDGLR